MSVKLRPPTVADGSVLWSLVRDSGNLDVNSQYCYLIFADHFSTTCVVAELDGAVAGAVIGYLKPAEPDTFFVWQVVVGDACRGHGVGSAMVKWILQQTGARWLQASVTPTNEASRRLFSGVADALGAGCEVRPWLSADDFGGDDHEDEELFNIGPIQPHQAPTQPLS